MKNLTIKILITAFTTSTPTSNKKKMAQMKKKKMAASQALNGALRAKLYYNAF